MLIVATLVTVSGCDRPPSGPALKVEWPTEQKKAMEPGRDEDAWALVPHESPAGCDRSKDERALAVERSQRALIARLRRAAADPEADAAKAARHNRFELVWLVPMDRRHPIGMVCETPEHSYMSTARSLELAHVYVSELPGDAHPDSARLSAYGRRYNLALLRHPSFPYADLCREGSPDRFVSVASVTRPDEWLGPRLPLTDQPRNLGEAARHGSLVAVDRWIARDRQRLNAPDDFGLTPLAWAVLYDRQDNVRRLLAAGAEPAPSVCGLHPAASAKALAMVLKRPYANELADRPKRAFP